MQWVKKVGVLDQVGLDVHVPLVVQLQVPVGERVRRYFAPELLQKPSDVTVAKWRADTATAYSVHVAGMWQSMQHALDVADVDEYWRMWSRALEKAMADVHNMHSEQQCRFFGHGAAWLVEMEPSNEEVVLPAQEPGQVMLLEVEASKMGQSGQ
eukprot:11797982-Alexandrium_andersonii.AAC.1